jgi:hypothetical protein
MTPKGLAGLAAIMMLGACGGGGSDGFGFATRLGAAEEVFSDLEAEVVTPAPSVPAGGTALYRGYAAVVIDDDATSDLVLLGDAEVTADFSTDTITGGADNFEGGRDASDFARYDGALTLEDGAISGSSIDARLSGTLTGGGNTVVVDNALEGEFRGDPIEGIALGSQEDIRLNGTPRPGLILLGTR